MAKEVELKLCASLSGLAQLKTALLPELGGVIHSQHLANTYFDTPDFQLNAHKIALRIRKVDDRYVQTLKTKGASVGGLHQRGEWEWDVASDALNADLLRGSAFPANIDIATLHPVFRTDFQRTSMLVNSGSSQIELALDEGQVLAGEKSTALAEVELELKSGEIAELFDLADKIAAEIPVWLSDVSKAERGLRLLRQGERKRAGFNLQESMSAVQLADSWTQRLLRDWLQSVEDFRAAPAFATFLDMRQMLAELAHWYQGVYVKLYLSANPLAGEFDAALALLLDLVPSAGDIFRNPQLMERFQESKACGLLALGISRQLASRP